ncbi:hypothetical protein RAM80_31230 (plasmid) [Pseudomonas sp. App30]|uniref:hypothetical protein n=1 Tax=Pseudomonas sp. App30 TaxID=3068990 RepID=UPI003A80EE14
MVNPLTSQRLSALIMVSALLAGCSYHDLQPTSHLWSRSTPQAQDALQGINVSAAHWPTEQWWNAFGDQQLDALMHEALDKNPTLNLAATRVRQARPSWA